MIIGDALAFIKRGRGTFDAIVSDLTEPLPDSPSFPLFNGEVFRDVKARLAPGGVYVLQASTAGFHNLALHAKMARTLRALLQARALVSTRTFRRSTTTGRSSPAATRSTSPRSSPQRIDALRRGAARGENYFYDAETHRALVQPAAVPASRTRKERGRLRVSDEPLRRTALFDVHRALGARIVPFGGFEMPVQYTGILAEHNAVRKRAGMFDLSHMAQFELRGTGVAAWADALTVNHVATMKPLQARYNVFTNDAGGAHDDVIFYRLAGRWLLIVNAANAHKMWAHLQAQCRGDVELTDLRGERALIAVQGPRSVEVLAPLVDADIAALAYYTCAETKAGGVDAVVARTGYTGEDGFEFFCRPTPPAACGRR